MFSFSNPRVRRNVQASGVYGVSLECRSWRFFFPLSGKKSGISCSSIVELEEDQALDECFFPL